MTHALVPDAEVIDRTSASALLEGVFGAAEAARERIRRQTRGLRVLQDVKLRSGARLPPTLTLLAADRDRAHFRLVDQIALSRPWLSDLLLDDLRRYQPGNELSPRIIASLDLLLGRSHGKQLFRATKVLNGLDKVEAHAGAFAVRASSDAAWIRAAGPVLDHLTRLEGDEQASTLFRPELQAIRRYLEKPNQRNSLVDAVIGGVRITARRAARRVNDHFDRVCEKERGTRGSMRSLAARAYDVIVLDEMMADATDAALLACTRAGLPAWSTPHQLDQALLAIRRAADGSDISLSKLAGDVRSPSTRLL